MTKKYATSCAVLLAMLLGGCSHLPSVGPDYAVPALPMPSGWQAQAEVQVQVQAPKSTPEPAPDLARWWRQLDDPMLDRLVTDALASSLDVRLAQSRLRQARAARGRQR